MVGIYLFQRFLHKLDDYKFERFWELRFLNRRRLYAAIAFIYYFIALGIINQLLLWGNDSIFLGMIVILFTAFIYGYYYLRSMLRFIAINNQRYFQLKAGFTQDSFNKDNVVG